MLWSLSLVSPGASSGGGAGRIEGVAVDAATGRPIQGATVSLPGFGARTTSAGDGTFSFPASYRVDGPYRQLTAVVEARGYGTWRADGLPLRPGTTLRLHAELRRAPFHHTAVPAEQLAARGGSARASVPQGGSTCTGWDDTLVPPKEIHVWITADSVSRKYPFIFYVEHVLPSEWVPSWDGDALRAGAIAVKTYAWFKAQPGQASIPGPPCADVLDTSQDQVFDPTYSYSTTDAAAEATLGSGARRQKEIFLAQYWSGSDWKKCQTVGPNGPYPGRMSQYGTQTCAEQGKAWPDIVKVFYTGIGFVYLHNLALDPSVETSDTYAWLREPGTEWERRNGAAHTGGWYFDITSPDTIGSVYQTRPFQGTANTAYHAEWALRCPKLSSTKCIVEIQVNGIVNFTAYGWKHKVGVPRDGVWHHYSFNPTPAGVTHGSVRIRFTSNQHFHLDSLILKRR